ncbi:MAG: glucosamine-6-phosphate deaminase, partial [Acidobacteria bacterium]|nr:glucosamine-6-phosphate deaminase [Acidobacteriota bacterium]
KRKNDAVLGLATGSTPLAMYKILIERCETGDISFRNVKTFNLDEYVGLGENHPQSYRNYMQRHFFDFIDVLLRNTHVPDGGASDPTLVGPEYELRIKEAGGIDLQILGIGANGHIGFNEPSSSLSSRTRIKTLTPKTIQDNSRFFKKGEFQPHLAITMGIGTILEAKQIVLMACGRSKARAIAAAIEGSITAMVPATSLQLHPHAMLVLDRSAASELRLVDYYNFVRSEQEKLSEQYPH